jgi:hypothetical protein
VALRYRVPRRACTRHDLILQGLASGLADLAAGGITERSGARWGGLLPLSLAAVLANTALLLTLVGLCGGVLRGCCTP